MESLLIIFFLIYIIAISLEAYLDFKNDTGIYYWKDSLVSICLGFLGIMVRLLGKGLWLAIWYFIYELSPFKIPATPLTWILLFFLNELVYYWFHRISHENRFFWAVHVNHHSSEKFNFSVSARIPFLNSIFHNAFWIVLPFMGFDPTMVFAVETVSFLFAFFQHTQLVKKLPSSIEYIFNTPSHHRVHHAVNPLYLNKNYGNVLILYDRMFGTFQEERADIPPEFGITKNINTYNIFSVIFHEWGSMWSDFNTRRLDNKKASSRKTK